MPCMHPVTRSPLQHNVYATREEETQAMIELACRLKKICSKYTSHDGAPLWLDVGMDSGPVTGKILGKTKSFWCLFGRPIIGAARYPNP